MNSRHQKEFVAIVLGLFLLSTVVAGFVDSETPTGAQVFDFSDLAESQVGSAVRFLFFDLEEVWSTGIASDQYYDATSKRFKIDNIVSDAENGVTLAIQLRDVLIAVRLIFSILVGLALFAITGMLTKGFKGVRATISIILTILGTVFIPIAALTTFALTLSTLFLAALLALLLTPFWWFIFRSPNKTRGQYGFDVIVYAGLGYFSFQYSNFASVLQAGFFEFIGNILSIACVVLFIHAFWKAAFPDNEGLDEVIGKRLPGSGWVNPKKIKRDTTKAENKALNDWILSVKEVKEVKSARDQVVALITAYKNLLGNQPISNLKRSVKDIIAMHANIKKTLNNSEWDAKRGARAKRQLHKSFKKVLDDLTVAGANPTEVANLQKLQEDSAVIHDQDVAPNIETAKDNFERMIPNLNAKRAPIEVLLSRIEDWTPPNPDNPADLKDETVNYSIGATAYTKKGDELINQYIADLKTGVEDKLTIALQQDVRAIKEIRKIPSKLKEIKESLS